MTIPKELGHILSIDPEIMGGEICFTGTRIPVYILLDNLRAGVTLYDFFDSYPDLTRAQVQTVMDWERSLAYGALGMAVVV